MKQFTKVTQLIFIYLFLLIALSFPGKSFNSDEWDEKMWCVHTSPIMLRDSNAIAGAIDLKNPTLITPEEENIHHRMTLHHCLGGIIPDVAMG